MKISIVIPVYEAKGRAIEFLKELFYSISVQTYKDFEIIISDHSKNNEIEIFCSKNNLNIIHFYNNRGVGNSSINMNEGIKRATGDIIKIMHMDDVIFNPNTLYLIAKSFELNKEKKWGAVGFNHNYEQDRISNIKRTIIPDINGVFGCPSVSFFIRNVEEPDFFDENLIIINDHDMHKRLFKKYGEPLIINDICITIRMHQEQVSSWIDKGREVKEWEYFNKKQI